MILSLKDVARRRAERLRRKGPPAVNQVWLARHNRLRKAKGMEPRKIS